MSYQHKRNTVSGKVPVASDFKPGEILVNTADGALYLLDTGGIVRRFDNRAIIDALLLDKLDKAATAANSLQLGGETAAQWDAKKSVGVGQVWGNYLASRTYNTTYQNTTGRPIMVAVCNNDANYPDTLQVSADGTTYIDVTQPIYDGTNGWWRMGLMGAILIPPGHFYKYSSNKKPARWLELR